jgi:DNA-binding NtrC family response regulator
VTPLGSDSPVSVDVRVVCATHRPLETLARSGDFRADLLARLRGFTVTLPPLRARRVDLGLIVRSLLGRLCEGRPLPTLSTAAVRALFTYPWPHNVRELVKALATALALAEAGPIRAEHLPERVQKATQGAAAVAVAPPAPSAADGVMPRAAGAELATGSDVPGASVASGAGGGSGASESQGLPRRERLVALMREYQGNVAAVARVLGKARTQIHRWLDRYGIDPDEYRS